MSFPTNTSPYGTGINLPSSPMSQGQGSRGGLFQSLFGKPERNYQQSLLGPEQQSLYSQLLGASQNPGAGGAFGSASDYYRGLLSDDNASIDAFAAPELRRFNEQIVPGLAEQFAGMGSGGLSSSGFRNAAVNAGADLSERLASMRAQLKQQAAQGLTGIGQMGLQKYFENIHRPETFGLAGGLSEGIGKGLGTAGASFLGSKFG